MLGLDSAVPLWVQQQLQRLVDRLEADEIGPDTLGIIRSELMQLGLERYVPETLAKALAKRKVDD